MRFSLVAHSGLKYLHDLKEHDNGLIKLVHKKSLKTKQNDIPLKHNYLLHLHLKF